MKYEDLKIGMTVQIVRVCESYSKDPSGLVWQNSWSPEMTYHIGCRGEILGWAEWGVDIDVPLGNPYTWPWESLEPVEDVPITERKEHEPWTYTTG